jgi:hypothetical protein
VLINPPAAGATSKQRRADQGINVYTIYATPPATRSNPRSVGPFNHSPSLLSNRVVS